MLTEQNPLVGCWIVFRHTLLPPTRIAELQADAVIEQAAAGRRPVPATRDDAVVKLGAVCLDRHAFHALQALAEDLEADLDDRIDAAERRATAYEHATREHAERSLRQLRDHLVARTPRVLALPHDAEADCSLSQHYVTNGYGDWLGRFGACERGEHLSLDILWPQEIDDRPPVREMTRGGLLVGPRRAGVDEIATRLADRVRANDAWCERAHVRSDKYIEICGARIETEHARRWYAAVSQLRAITLEHALGTAPLEFE